MNFGDATDESTAFKIMDQALDHGVKASEISEVITHLAFHAGWPNAMSAVPVAKDVFEKRPK